MVSIKEALKDRAKVTEDRARVTEDELDKYTQKNLRGKFVITAAPNKETPFKKEADLTDADNALANNIITLAKSKYDVDIEVGDIASCHYLPKGGIFFSMWNMRPGSAYQKLAGAIKQKPHSPSLNIYFNFMLTKRRSALLFEVRKLKKEGTIARYYSDEEGVICIKKDEKDKNIKLSSFHQTKTSPVKTYTIPELHQAISTSET